MSAVCRHRAGPVARGRGRRRTLACGYHGWTYGLDGRLARAPEMEGVHGCDLASVRLPPFPAEAFGPYVFVCLDPGAPTLLEGLEHIPRELDALGIELGALRRYAARDYEVACDWKVYVDNFLEGYHLPAVHPSLYRELDYGRYRVDTFGLFSSQHAPLRSAGPDDRALYYWIFPNLTLSIYPDSMSTNVILPAGPGKTRVTFEWFFLPDAIAREPAAIERTIARSHEVQLEDQEVCEAVQRGLASRTYDRGRYSVARENGVHHFHQLLRAFLRRERDRRPVLP
jgi:choline monooxygenase